jgi:hypothetical protein
MIFASVPINESGVRDAVKKLGEIPFIVDPMVPMGEVWLGTIRDGRFVLHAKVVP